MREAVPAAILVVLFSSSACFKVPLAKPGDVPVSRPLLGPWLCTSVRPVEKEADRTMKIHLYRFDDAQYYVETRSSEGLSRYRMHATRVHDVELFNLAELTEKFNPWPWSVLRLTLRSTDVLEIALVNDDDRLAKLTDRQAMSFIRSHVKDATLYHPFLTCQRGEDDPAEGDAG